MRTQDKLTDQVSDTCKAIEAQLKGRTHPREQEIIANQCKIDDVNESHIRTVMEIPEKRRKSTKKKKKIKLINPDVYAQFTHKIILK